jgi:hypothetical protein
VKLVDGNAAAAGGTGAPHAATLASSSSSSSSTALHMGLLARPHDSISSATGSNGVLSYLQQQQQQQQQQQGPGGADKLAAMQAAATPTGAAAAAGAAGAAGLGGQQPPQPPQQPFFVELWDVSGQPKYEQLRSVFYKQLNGVILVHDVTSTASLARLPRWASEVAHEGSFVAALPEQLAAANVGGLPVPVLVLGNKADRLRAGALGAGSASGSAGAAGAFLHSVCAQALLRGRGAAACGAAGGWRRWLQRTLHSVTRGVLGRSSSSSGGGGGGGRSHSGGLGSSDLPVTSSGSSVAAAAGLAGLGGAGAGAGGGAGLGGAGGGADGGAGSGAGGGLEPHLRGLTVSAAAGDMDWAQLHAFFRALWERRYQPAGAGAAAGGDRFPSALSPPLGGGGGRHRHTLSGGIVGVPAAAAAAGAGAGAGVGAGARPTLPLLGDGRGGAGGNDARLDDDWV